MKKNVRLTSPRYCDLGVNAGLTRFDITGTIYMTSEELEEYYASKMGVDIIIVKDVITINEEENK